MKRILFCLTAAVTALAFHSTTVSAATIVSWTDSTLDPGSAQSIPAAVGTGTISRGAALAYAAAANSYNSSGWALATEQSAPTFADQYVDIAVSTVGASGLTLNFTDRKSSTGPSTFKVYYSTTGTAGPFTLIPGATFTLATTGTGRNVDLSGIPAINNNANVVFRIHGFGATAAGGTGRIFSVSITDGAAPPPATAGTVAQVKASAEGAEWQTTGIVTSVGGNTGRRAFTIQDATDAILIDNKNSLTYTLPAVGDSVWIRRGNKTTFSNTIQLQPAATADVIVNSSGNPLPAPVVFASVNDFLAANVTSTQAKLVRLQNVYLKDAATSAGAVNWLDASATVGGHNFGFTSDGASTVTVRITNDLNGKETNWQNKVRPATNNSSDRVDIVAVAAQFTVAAVPTLQISLNDPVGTSAKTDATGPIRPATTAVSDWRKYNK